MEGLNELSLVNREIIKQDNFVDKKKILSNWWCCCCLSLIDFKLFLRLITIHTLIIKLIIANMQTSTGIKIILHR